MKLSRFILLSIFITLLVFLSNASAYASIGDLLILEGARSEASSDLFLNVELKKLWWRFPRRRWSQTSPDSTISLKLMIEVLLNSGIVSVNNPKSSKQRGFAELTVLLLPRYSLMMDEDNDEDGPIGTVQWLNDSAIYFALRLWFVSGSHPLRINRSCWFNASAISTSSQFFATADFAEIDAKNEGIVRSKIAGNEQEFREEMEKEKKVWKDVISVDERHEQCEMILRNTERKLKQISKFAVSDYGVEEHVDSVKAMKEGVAVLQEVSSKDIHRIALLGRLLCILPEAFGRLYEFRVLYLLSNQLKAGSGFVEDLKNLEEPTAASHILDSLREDFRKATVVIELGPYLFKHPINTLMEMNAGLSKQEARYIASLHVDATGLIDYVLILLNSMNTVFVEGAVVSRSMNLSTRVLEYIIQETRSEVQTKEAEYSLRSGDEYLGVYDEHQRNETNGVLSRNAEFSQLIIDYQRKLREGSESVHAAEEHSRKLSMEVSVLKHEKEILSNLEKRAFDEVRSLSERVYRLQASLDMIQSADEVREEARRAEETKQENYVNKIEKEWAQVKNELQEVLDNVRCLTADREETMKNAMRQVEHLENRLANALSSLSAAETRAAVAEARCSEMEKTKSLETKVTGDDGSVIREEFEKLKEEFKVTKEHMVQYKSIAQVHEAEIGGQGNLKTIELLCRIGSQMMESDLVDSLIPLVKRLAGGIPLVKRLAGGEWFTARVAARGLVHIGYSSAPDTLKAELRPIYSQLCLDDMLMVMRYMRIFFWGSVIRNFGVTRNTDWGFSFWG